MDSVEAVAARSSLAMVAVRLLLLPAGLAVAVILAKYLGASILGTYSLVATLAVVVLPLSAMGFGTGAFFYISRDSYPLGAVLGTSLFCGVLHGVIALVVLAVLYWSGALGSAGELLDVDHTILILAYFPLLGVNLVLLDILLALGMVTQFNAMVLIRALFQLFLIFLFVAWYDWGLQGALLGSLLAASIGSSVALISLRSALADCRLDFNFLSSSYSYGMKSWLGVFYSKLHLRVGQLFLAPFVSAAEMGNFFLAAKIAEQPLLIAEAVTPVFSRILARQNELSSRVRIAETLHRLIFWATMAICVACGLVLYSVDHLLVRDYSDLVGVASMLLVGSAVYVSGKVLNDFFMATGLPSVSGVIGVSSLVLATAFYLVFVPAFGLYGGVIAVLLSNVFRSFVCVLYFNRESGGAGFSLYSFRVSDVLWAIKVFRSILVGKRE